MRQAIAERDVYGGIAVEPAVTVYTASAGSVPVAQLLQGAGQEITAAMGGTAATTDVVPTPAADPRGAAFGAALLPLVLAGEVAAVLLVLVIAPGVIQALAVTVGAAVAGGMALLVTGTWLEVLPDAGWATWGALSLTILAIAATASGLNALIGRAGMGLAAVLMIFVGNPLSGATSAPELLPQPAGLIGQLFPPGAGANLVRSVTFFDGNGAQTHLLVLSTWVLLGLLTTVFGARLWPDFRR